MVATVPKAPAVPDAASGAWRCRGHPERGFHDIFFSYRVKSEGPKWYALRGRAESRRAWLELARVSAAPF